MATVHTLHVVQELTVLDCVTCGLSYAMPEAYRDRRQTDGAMFYCPAGHPQSFRDSEVKRLTRQRDEARAERDRLANDLLDAAKAARALRRRLAGGVCPCCHRTFAQLTAHMKTQHPDYAAKGAKP